MPYRKIFIETNGIYHIVNRSIARFCIYNNNQEYQRFVELLKFYQHDKLPFKYSYYNNLSKKEKLKIIIYIQKKPKIVNIYVFCLMPNHFHLLVKQNTNNGISTYMRLIQNSYAKYFNIKHKRKGPLFESSFKAIKIETDEQLVHVSRYIHLNPVSSGFVSIDQINQYSWSSYNDYDRRRKNSFIEKSLILDYFKNFKHYKNFVNNQADYQRELQNIKKLVLE